MKDTFDGFAEICKKSIKYDPWVQDRGVLGYVEELGLELLEVKVAINNNDPKNLQEELGDVLIDWMHLCLLAQEKYGISSKDIIQDAMDKLKRRKPYILENRKPTKEEARVCWQNAKAHEKINNNK